MLMNARPTRMLPVHRRTCFLVLVGGPSDCCCWPSCSNLAIKCAAHSGSNVGRKIWGRVCPRPIPLGFHACHKPDFPPSQIRLCVAGFMARFVLLLLIHQALLPTGK